MTKYLARGSQLGPAEPAAGMMWMRIALLEATFLGFVGSGGAEDLGLFFQVDLGM